jgi:hypothetical protein
VRKRLLAVAEVLKWAEPHAWEDDEEDDGSPSVVFGPGSCSVASG